MHHGTLVLIKQKQTVLKYYSLVNCIHAKKLTLLKHVTMADPGWGIWGKCPPPPPHLVEKPAMLLIKIGTKRCQAKISLSTHENIHISLAFITNSPETKAN